MKCLFYGKGKIEGEIVTDINKAEGKILLTDKISISYSYISKLKKLRGLILTNTTPLSHSFILIKELGICCLLVFDGKLTENDFIKIDFDKKYMEVVRNGRNLMQYKSQSSNS